jgi:hypothetical protein
MDLCQTHNTTDSAEAVDADFGNHVELEALDNGGRCVKRSVLVLKKTRRRISTALLEVL